MEFGILFTSQPHRDREPYPHRAVHERVTDEIIVADRLGFDCAWLAEHHFSTEYGIMPDVWVYAGHLAALTKRIKLGMAVVTLPLANPVRTVENVGFVDILSGGRVVLGVGSGYRKYEFDGFGLDFEARRDMQEEALAIVLDLLRTGRSSRKGKHFAVDVSGEHELLPQSVQRPYPPLFLAGATDRSIATAGRLGFGLMLSTLTPFAKLSTQIAHYRTHLEEASIDARKNLRSGISTSHAGCTWRRRTPRPSARVRKDCCATSNTSSAATRRATWGRSPRARAQWRAGSITTRWRAPPSFTAHPRPSSPASPNSRRRPVSRPSCCTIRLGMERSAPKAPSSSSLAR